MTNDQQLHPDHHRSLVEESGILSELIAARGYRTVIVKADLRRLGFADCQCLVPSLVIPLHGVSGQIVGYQGRPDTPRVKGGKVIEYETPAGTKTVLDIHPSVRHLLGDPTVPLFVTEGVKKGDSLASRGCCAVALLGVWNWRGTNEAGGKVMLPDWESVAFNHRQVYIVFDSDVILKSEVHSALARLGAWLGSRGAVVAFIYLPAGRSGAKTGVDDYLAADKTIDDLLTLATRELKETEASPDESYEVTRSGSQATALVDLARRAELFHDPSGAGFARLDLDGGLQIWPLQSKRFRNWLRRDYYLHFGVAPSSDAINAALGVVEGIAGFDGPEMELHNRLAWSNGAIYYDLADQGWRAVRIDESGWELVSRPPILFRRYAHQRPQVEPVRGGHIEAILDSLNVCDQDRVLLLIWLVAAFIPEIPHPIPNFHGEKGAGKSVGQRVLRRLIDPSTIESLSFSNDIREIVQQFSHHYAPVYDNVDTVPAWLSDLLCRAVTGGGFSKRELYSDDEDIIYSYRRVVMINGVNVAPSRPDLLDRSLLIGLERIPKEERREEREFWECFEAVRPYVLGAIFDAISAAMRVYPRLEFASLERMADFTRWGAAISEALGYGFEAFLRAYASSLGVQTREAVEGHVVGHALLILMKERSDWSGSPTELLEALEKAGEDAKLFKRSANGRVDSKGWPGAPHILSRRLNDIRSNLADLGIVVTTDNRTSGERQISIRRAATQEGNSSVISVTGVTRDATRRNGDDANGAGDAKLVSVEEAQWEMEIE